jgi:hypothetical protein
MGTFLYAISYFVKEIKDIEEERVGEEKKK